LRLRSGRHRSGEKNGKESRLEEKKSREILHSGISKLFACPHKADF
jgi:hypothetical protein